MPQDNDPEERELEWRPLQISIISQPKCHIQTNYCLYVADIHFDIIF